MKKNKELPKKLNKWVNVLHKCCVCSNTQEIYTYPPEYVQDKHGDWQMKMDVDKDKRVWMLCEKCKKISLFLPID